MAQHFLLSAERRDMSMYEVSNYSEKDSFWKFVELLWGSRSCQPCPWCGAMDDHYFMDSRLKWRCKSCALEFSPTTATIFADRKMPYKKILLGMTMFVSASKGTSIPEVSADLDLSHKAAFVFHSKLRECIVRNADDTRLKGVVHVDGGYFGGKPRKANRRHRLSAAEIEARIKKSTGQRVRKTKFTRQDRINAEKRKRRRVVFVLRELHSEQGRGACRTIVAISKSENATDATALICKYVTPGTIIMTDENPAYSRLGIWFDHRVVEHSKEFKSIDGVDENQAESFFSRMRRREYGVSHGYRPKYLMDYASEMAWREDVRRATEGTKLLRLFKMIAASGLSRWFRGYWQGAHRPEELLMYGMTE